MAYRNSTFNVPIQIVYYEGYPMKPPVVQVTPTPDMVIKANEFVREDGVVVSEIIKRWNAQCNSKLLIEDLIAVFSFKMPVFARGPGAVPPASQPQQPAANYQAPIQQGYQVPIQQGYQAPAPQGSSLALALREEFEIKASELISELEVLEKDRLALAKSAENIKQTKSVLQEEQMQANGRLSAVEQARVSTLQWISANSATEAATMTLDQLLPSNNPLSTCLLQSLTLEQAYEETANALVEGFGLHRCSTEDFIRSLKSLYRDLFLEILRKERATQMLRTG